MNSAKSPTVKLLDCIDAATINKTMPVPMFIMFSLTERNSSFSKLSLRAALRLVSLIFSKWLITLLSPSATFNRLHPVTNVGDKFGHVAGSGSGWLDGTF